MVGKAAYAVHRVAVAAEVVALDAPAARVQAKIIATKGVIMSRNAAATHSLVSLPTIIIFYWLSLFLVDNDHCLRGSADDQLLIVVNNDRVLSWVLMLIASFFIRRLTAVILRP